jgi:hypothetical protein
VQAALRDLGCPSDVLHDVVMAMLDLLLGEQNEIDAALLEAHHGSDSVLSDDMPPPDELWEDLE